MARSEFLIEAQARGFIFQCTDEASLDAALCAGPGRGYIGFDPTADSLHVGSLLQIMLLRLFQKHGHKPYVLLGGGTGQVGDPSFREEARQLLNEQRIATNLAAISSIFTTFLRFGEGSADAMRVNNAEWLDQLGYIQLLREIGQHFSVNRMLAFDSVRSRLEREQGLTFLEFNYSILQSYDFRELHRRHGVTLQMGGSDQWGNIVSGVDLIRRTEGRQVFGLTTPLLTTASGAKMGKTASGAVWLSADKLSPYHYWQFWRNTDDQDVGRFLKLFTDLTLPEIARLEALQGAEINQAKIVLATAATAIAHGEHAAAQAAEAAQQRFEAGTITAGLPAAVFAPEYFQTPSPAFSLIAAASAADGSAISNSEARRLIREGSVRIDGELIRNETEMIKPETGMEITVGKKRHWVLKER